MDDLDGTRKRKKPKGRVGFIVNHVIKTPLFMPHGNCPNRVKKSKQKTANFPQGKTSIHRPRCLHQVIAIIHYLLAVMQHLLLQKQLQQQRVHHINFCCLHVSITKD